MFELNWMGLLEVALRQRITLQGVLPLLAVKTRKCKFQPENAIQNKENTKAIHERLFNNCGSTSNVLP